MAIFVTSINIQKVIILYSDLFIYYISDTFVDTYVW